MKPYIGGIVSLLLPLGVSGTGIISTIAGNGTQGYGGDGGPAANAVLYAPERVAVDPSGNIYLVDASNVRIRKIAANTGIITTIAGNGACAFSGDNGPATSASLCYPSSIALDGAGNLLITDQYNVRVRKVNLTTGVITTVAGNGTWGFAGDGGPATAAELSAPHGIAIDPAGNFYIGDIYNARVRRVDGATGIITTYAGSGSWDYAGDGGPATAAGFNSPAGLSLDSAGNLFVADSGNNAIRRIDAVTGVISTVAGTGVPGFNGDGILAISAQLHQPDDVVVDPSGNLWISDSVNNRLRKVDATSGTISTVAGDGEQGYSGDGGDALAAALFYPNGVALDTNGSLYFADEGNQRLRKVIFLQPTSTTLSVNPNPATVFQAVTLTATVSAASATGSIQFYDGATPIAYASLTNGSATYISQFTAGTHSFTAVYSGDGSFSSSSSAAVSVTINKQPVRTNLNVSPIPANEGQPVFLQARLDWSQATGTVQYLDGNTLLGASAVGSVLSVILSPGVHSLTAAYSGDSNFAANTSAPVSLTVRPSTTLTLTSQVNPSVFGQAVTFTGTLSPSAATGPVYLTAGPYSLGPASVSNGTFSLTTNLLNAGTYSVQATYSGDANYAPGASPSITQTVNKANATISLTSGSNPSRLGDAVTFRVTVTPAAATGSMTFYDGSAVLGTAALGGGLASFTTTTLSRGTHSIKAVYAGDANVNSATSAILSQTVKR